MTQPIFPAAALDRFRALYPAQPGMLSHRIADHPLLTLEALVGLATRLGRANVEYNAGDLPFGIEPDDIQYTGLSPEETIRRIEECGSWMVLKNVNNDPAYAALLEKALGELAPLIEPVSGELLTKVGFIFVSSPGAVTPFHLDPEHNVLLQIRGTKTMMVVRGDDETVPPQRHEEYHTGSHRNVVWQDRFVDYGQSFELTPGDAVHVPLKWPHWVKNGPEPSVSLSITWRSNWTYEEADVRAMNRMLRQIGMNPKGPKPFPLPNTGKSVAYRAIRKAKGVIGKG